MYQYMFEPLRSFTKLKVYTHSSWNIHSCESFFLDSDDSNDHIVAACIIEAANKVAADFITV